VHFLYLTVFTLFEQSFGFFSIKKFNFEPRTSSYLLVFYGLMYASVQGSGLKKLKNRIDNDNQILSYAIIGLGICFLIYPFINGIIQYIILLAPFGITSGIANTLISSAVSKEVDPKLIGGAFGISASVGSLTRIIAPFIGGWSIDNIGIEAPYILSFFITILIYYLNKKLITAKNIID